MEVCIIPVTPFLQNCSLLICERSRKGALVDPGGEPERILEVVRDCGVTLEKILLTHGHADHIGAVGRLAVDRGLPIEGPHEADGFLLDALPQWCAQFGLPPGEPFTPKRWLTDGQQVEFGDQTLVVYHCPGHTPGHVIFFHAPTAVAIVGDVIFKGSIGRTDLPRGDHATLLKSIRQRIWPLGDAVTLLPGHGPTTSVGEERVHNPYVGDSTTKRV